jgi:hypothetical protein
MQNSLVFTLVALCRASHTSLMFGTATKTTGEPLATACGSVALFLGVLAKTQAPLLFSPPPVTLDESYDPGAFSELLDFPEAMAALDSQNRSATREALLGVVEKHGLQDVVSVTANHRHFEMDSSEILVEQATGNSSTTTVLKHDALPSSVTPLVPYMWVLRQGRFQPVEFMSKPSVEARANLRNLQRSASFLQDFAAVLGQHKVAHLYGFAIVHRQHIPRGSTMETSDVVSRTLWTKLSDDTNEQASGCKPIKATVAWRIKSSGNSGPADDCGHCVAHQTCTHNGSGGSDSCSHVARCHHCQHCDPGAHWGVGWATNSMVIHGVADSPLTRAAGASGTVILL